ncbi:MAG: signal recognition particle-docking protein FtsY [Deltaproteobacteria bacterium]|jgi:fused signal recognition particle receptor|nr:signal recognition particle-docking protein FtsY [Deltaproteobacteria bacterium]
MAFNWLKKNKNKSSDSDFAEPQQSAENPGEDPGEDPEQLEPAENGGDPPDAPGEADEPLSTEESDDSEAVTVESDASGGYFSRLKSRLSKTRRNLADGLDRIFVGGRSIDDDVLEELEELLITADIGVQTALELIERISSSKINDAEQLRQRMCDEILEILETPTPMAVTPSSGPRVIMIVGVNGVGKTTTIGKIAAKAAAAGQKVIIAACDTFRAAAIEQLMVWAERANAEIVKHKENSDPAAVAFDAVAAASARAADIVLIDTAGRLHTQVNLMEELKKIKRSISKQISDAPHEILLVLDATTGQNAVSQAKLFDEALGITGLALTKLDGTAKGGIAISICGTLNVPLQYIGIGEQIEDLREFDPEQYVRALFE